MVPPNTEEFLHAQFMAMWKEKILVWASRIHKGNWWGGGGDHAFLEIINQKALKYITIYDILSNWSLIVYEKCVVAANFLFGFQRGYFSGSHKPRRHRSHETRVSLTIPRCAERMRNGKRQKEAQQQKLPLLHNFRISGKSYKIIGGKIFAGKMGHFRVAVNLIMKRG